MPSITSWLRLEPRSRNADMKTSLQARVYDPLWLLARQWQLGEFQGEDNGSPVLAHWSGAAAPLTRFHAGVPPTRTGADTQKLEVAAQAYDGRVVPLETVVEREPVRERHEHSDRQDAALQKLRLAAEGGQHFLRMLDQQFDQKLLARDYRRAFVRKYPLPALEPDQRSLLDADSAAFMELAAGRVPDGRKLFAEFSAAGEGDIVLAPELEIEAADRAEVQATARAWCQWHTSFFSEPETPATSAWIPSRLEYAFSVSAHLGSEEVTLTAPEYSGGRLDWYAFDVNPDISLGATHNPSLPEVTGRAIPAPASFRGMPAARFWEFEDAQVDFGAVDAGPTDLARMLLVEFALTYGNDWFVIPVELPVGAVYRTDTLIITDTFGVRTLVKPSSTVAGGSSPWRVFELTQGRMSARGGTTPNLFFLPPALLRSMESQAVEEVLFLRDEMANLAWGIERLVESPIEQPLNRYEAYIVEERRQAAAHKSAEPRNVLHYRLATEVPDYWVPLLPVKQGEEIRLRRGVIRKADGSPKTIRAQGRILELGQDPTLRDEEVPREGVRVTRSYQFARWIDGSSHLWIGRRKGVGRGEGSSGLRFDVASESGVPADE